MRQMYNCSFDYNALDRLTDQTDNTSFKLWNYDANSNRTNAQTGSTNYLYTIATSSNRLQSLAGPVAKIYSYDAAGNPLSDGATAFTWNAAGKQVAWISLRHPGINLIQTLKA